MKNVDINFWNFITDEYFKASELLGLTTEKSVYIGGLKEFVF